jgi:hypothetical protein
MYQKAHELEPKDLYTLGALAEIKLRLLDVTGALPLFERLFAADPQREHPAANRGRQVVHDYHLRLAQSS